MPIDKTWNEKYSAFSAMLAEIKADNNAAAKYPSSHPLRRWLSRQRVRQRQGKLSDEQIEKLTLLIKAYIE